MSGAWREKRLAKEELVKPRYREYDVAAIADVVMADLGLATSICNRTCAQLRAQQQRQQRQPLPAQPASQPADAASPPERSHPEPLGYVRELCGQWERHLSTAVTAVAEQCGLPLMRVRHEHEDFGEPGRRPLSNLRAPWLYEIDDLLDLLAATPHPNHTSGESLVSSLGLVQLQLAAPTLAQLQERFAELAPHERQCGLDDDLRGWFAEERHHIGLRVLASGSVPMLRHFSKAGVPLGMRAQAWLAVLQLAPAEREHLHFAALQREVGRVALGIDASVRHDAATPLHEEPYFIFAEAVEEALLAFCRDPTVLERTAHLAGLPRLAGRNRAGQPCVFPPSGVLPGRGFSMFAFPLCYLYQGSLPLYLVLRELWVRYWCRLHCLSSQPGTLLPLLASFELMLQQRAPPLVAHLERLGVPAARMAGSWIATAFASYLPPEQTLLLWDRLLGFDSLELLPLLACAIFLFHERALLQAVDAEDVRHVLLDASELKVVPLLQAFLFDPQRLREL